MANAYSQLGNGPGRGGPNVYDELGAGRNRPIVPVARPYRPAGTRIGKPIPPGWNGTQTAPHPSTTPGATPTPGSPTPAPSPYDSTYYNSLNQATFDATNKINGYNQQGAYARTDLQNALAQLAHQQTLAVQGNQETENARGGFALGHLGQTIGETNRSYLDRQSADQQTFDRGDAARSAAIQAVQGGLSLTQVALAAAAADRASAAAAADPTLGVNTPGNGNPSTGTTAPAGSAHPGLTKGIPGHLQAIPRRGLTKGIPGHLHAIPRGPRA